MSDETHNPWSLGEGQRVYENPWLALDHHEVVNPAGKPGVYGVVRFKKLAVGVAPIEPDGSVHLVGQWRVPLGRYSWEIPEGGAEPGEAPEAAARRELREETGLVAAKLEPILALDLSNSCTDEQAVLFLASGLAPGPAAPEETEALGYKRVPFAEAFTAAVEGRITDALTVAALLRAYHMAKTGRLDAQLARAMLQGLD